MNHEFTETEFKYDAAKVDLTHFEHIVNLYFTITQKLVISGYDDYYTKGSDYLRHRYNNDHAELTVKRRLYASSTMERIEVDTKILPGQAHTVNQLANVLGYEFEFRIYKTCLIYWTKDVNIVYYVVYDASMQEKRRIIEIEANKGCRGDPKAAIIAAERDLHLWIPQVNEKQRLNQSMAEMFSTKLKVA
jgi:adenylate cyclase class IV